MLVVGQSRSSVSSSAGVAEAEQGNGGVKMSHTLSRSLWKNAIMEQFGKLRNDYNPPLLSVLAAKALAHRGQAHCTCCALSSNLSIFFQLAMARKGRLQTPWKNPSLPQEL